MPFLRRHSIQGGLPDREQEAFPAPFSHLFLALLLFTGALVTDAAAETVQDESALNPAKIKQHLADLSHADYFRRTAATQQLKQIPVEQAPLLTQTMNQGPLEVKLRVISILDHLYQERLETWEKLTQRFYRKKMSQHLKMLRKLQSNPNRRRRIPTRAEHPVRTARLEKAGREFDQLDDLFLQLRNSVNASVAQRSQETVNIGKELRETRAMIAVLGFNGKVYSNPESGLANQIPLTEQMLIDGRTNTNRVDVHLDDTWRGGNEGLEKLKRLQNLTSLYLIEDPIEGAPISKEERLQLQASIPELRIQIRGPARLGIQFKGNFRDNSGALVDAVTPNTSADKAGILAEDLIIELNEKKIESFDALVNELASYKPGETVQMKLIRDSKPITKSVKLYGWYPKTKP